MADAFGPLEEGVGALRAEIAEVLGADPASPPPGAQATRIDVGRLRSGLRLDDQRAAGPAILASQALSGLRRAYNRILTLSILGRFLPAGAAALLMSNPVSLGIGLAFAGQFLLDANRLQLAARRQRAKAAVRQFLGDVGFEPGTELADAVGGAQRQLRDEFSTRAAELQRTLTVEAWEIAACVYEATYVGSPD